MKQIIKKYISKIRITEKNIEIIIAILLGITTALNAWAVWTGALHSGNQDKNFTRSNQLTTDADTLNSDASQKLDIDIQTWLEIDSLHMEAQYAKEHNNIEEYDKCNWKIEQILNNRVSEEYRKEIEIALSQEEYTSPFRKEGFIDSYYAQTYKCLEEAKEKLEEGKRDNTNSDKLGLVSVLYTTVLFLLGITATFKQFKIKKTLLILSICTLIFAAIVMISVPWPTGINILDFF